jgi:hypothetical protein
MKAKIELTAEAVKAVIEGKKPTSMTKLAHGLGYKGSVSGSLTKKFRQLFPDIDVLLKRTAESAKGGAGDGDGKAKVAEQKASKAPKGKDKPVVKARGKWPRDPRNPFREGSYGKCYDILASHPAGLPREKLVDLLAKATGKDAKHAGYDCQVLLSAGPNEDGLSNNDGPRHRSCRPGFWVRRTSGHVQLVVD